MTCYKPLHAIDVGTRVDSGKKVFKFLKGEITSKSDKIQSLPCGQCIGCRLERSRQWAIRCVHEASLHSANCFITLTFNDKYLNKKQSLNKKDFVNFMKRLRKKWGSGIRFFHCGEYGGITQRPHHHACIFNFDFKDRELWTVRKGVKLYRSKELESLWTHPKTGESLGFSTIGDVTFESAAYVARYIMKKINGPLKESHYGKRTPDYVTMSRRPGIGRDWIEKYMSDVYPDDNVIIRNGKRRAKPPRYYDQIYDLTNPEEFANLKTIRQAKAKASPDNTPERLLTRFKCQQAKTKELTRSYENEC